ncbi:MAG: membrane protein insertase YidC [Parachlamydiaceae bacterium]|nr:membrane protein insertase YidC [Parachlamydiaceae bacterium]
MDRRTILFAIAAMLTLFGVNTFFDWQHQEKVDQWNKEQLGKNQSRFQQLEAKIQEDTATASDLPLVSFYADQDATTLLSEGIRSDDAIFTTSWSSESPSTVYIPSKDTAQPAEKFNLTIDGKKTGELLIYKQKDKEPLTLGSLPDIGTEEVQIVTFANTAQKSPPEIYLADYTNNILSLSQEKLDLLKQKIDPKHEVKATLTRNGIALVKSGQNYLPVGIYYGAKKHFVPFEDLAPVEASLNPNKKTSQEYYVLENEYQQLVFSNVGGALVEINLPFKTKNDLKSVVRPIEFDKNIHEDHPYNDHFPAHPYFTAGDKPQGPYLEHPEGSVGGYYPLLRRDLIETGDWKSVNVNPRYYALNLVSESPETAEALYTVKHFDATTLVLESKQKKRTITKTFRLNEAGAPYTFDAIIKVEGDKRGLWITSGIPEVELFSGSPEPILKYRVTRNQKPYVEVIALPKESTTNSSIHPDWLGNSNGFFGIIMDPLEDVSNGFLASYVPGQTVPSRLVEIDQSYNRFQAETFPGYQLMLPFKDSQKVMNLRVFAGPFSSEILRTVDNAFSDASTGYTPDYIAIQTYHGYFSFISEPFAKILFVLMSFFHSITGSWALSIVLLTVALRIMMYPLNAWSTKSMLGMQQVGPEIAAIQERNKKDPKKAQLEIMQLYKEKGVNPLTGCIPMLIQIPFLVGMFDLLKTTFELRGASFIPGWIDNLTAPDVLFSWKTPIFFIGNEFHLLPFLLGGVMFLQQRMSAPKIDVNKMTDQQRQQKAMTAFMPVIFTIMFYHFPSGLNIYWLSSMLLGMLQQWWMQKQQANAPVKPSVIIMPKGKK